MSLFKVIEESVKHRGRVVNLSVDKVRYPNGHIEIREKVEHSGGSVILGVLDDGQIVLIMQHRYPIDKIIYELPAGKLNKDEDPLDAAKREFEEETGYRANKWQKLTSFYTSPGYTSEILHVYLATDLTTGKQKLEPGEAHIELVNMSFEEAIQKIRVEEIIDGKTIIGILLARMTLYT
jgi:ADP-ribose pyrophosphatase